MSCSRALAPKAPTSNSSVICSAAVQPRISSGVEPCRSAANGRTKNGYAAGSSGTPSITWSITILPGHGISASGSTLATSSAIFTAKRARKGAA